MGGESDDHEFVLIPVARDHRVNSDGSETDWAVVDAAPSWADVATTSKAACFLASTATQSKQTRTQRPSSRSVSACECTHDEAEQVRILQPKGFMKNVARKGVRLSQRQQRGGGSHKGAQKAEQDSRAKAKQLKKEKKQHKVAERRATKKARRAPSIVRTSTSQAIRSGGP
jgi:hypothetical protein